MPGGDRRGPDGYGPMTGRGAGYCAGNTVPGYGAGGRGRSGVGFFARRGFRGGGGRMRGQGFSRWGDAGLNSSPAYRTNPVPVYQELRPEDEITMLKEQARTMEQEVTFINERIAELEEIKEQK